jgi:hypothetical protein
MPKHQDCAVAIEGILQQNFVVGVDPPSQPNHTHKGSNQRTSEYNPSTSVLVLFSEHAKLPPNVRFGSQLFLS